MAATNSANASACALTSTCKDLGLVTLDLGDYVALRDTVVQQQYRIEQLEYLWEEMKQLTRADDSETAYSETIYSESHESMGAAYSCAREPSSQYAHPFKSQIMQKLTIF